MPSQKQEFSFRGQTTDLLLLFAYGSFLELGWTPKYAGPNAIVGYTPRSWNKYDDEILVEANSEIMSVTGPAGTYDNAIKEVGEKIIENVKRDDKK